MQKNNLWSTQRIDDLMLQFKKTGVIPDDHPFFQRKLGKRKAGLNYGYTKDELLELLACKEDIIYFANNYCKIKTKIGKKLLKEVGGLRPYQVKMLRQYQANKYNITLASRQIGKSITVAIYVVWYILFSSDVNVLLLSETGQKAKDLLTKIKNIQDSLPFYMQKGLVYSSTQRRLYEGDCTLASENTTENSGVSGTYNFVYWDEMALLPADMQDKIFTGVFPTMAEAGDSAKFIITSTPRGRHNKFYKIWAGAISEKDSPNYLPFAYSKVYWYEVDGRDEAWVKNEKAIMGEIGFAREYDLSFDADEEMLITDLLRKSLNNKYQIYSEIHEGELHGMLKLSPNYSLSNFSDEFRKFHISIDLASGKKRDYTVFNIFEIVLKTHEEMERLEFYDSEADFFKLKQVGIVRSNTYKPEIMAKFLHNMLEAYFLIDNVRMTIEMNHKGDFFLEKLFNFRDKKNHMYGKREEIMVQYPRNMDFEHKVWEEGLVQNANTKEYATENINLVLEVNSIEISESVTIEEALSFGQDKKGNFKGLGENDDCFMTVLNCVGFLKTEDYAEFVDDLYNELYDDEKKFIETALDGDIDDEYESIGDENHGGSLGADDIY